MFTADGETLAGHRAVLFVHGGLSKRGAAVQSVASLPGVSAACGLGYRVLANNRTFFSRFVFRKDHADG